MSGLSLVLSVPESRQTRISAAALHRTHFFEYYYPATCRATSSHLGHLASTAHLTAVTTNQFVYVPTYGYIQCWLLDDMAIFISTEAARRDAGFCGSSPTSTTCISNEPFLHIVRWEIHHWWSEIILGRTNLKSFFFH